MHANKYLFYSRVEWIGDRSLPGLSIYLESFVNSIGRSLNRPPVRLVTTNDSCCDNRDGADFLGVVGLLLARSFFFGALAGTLPLGCGRADLFFAATAAVDTMLLQVGRDCQINGNETCNGVKEGEVKVWTIGSVKHKERSNLPSRKNLQLGLTASERLNKLPGS